ncbi:MAG: hypothetical protein NTW26_07090 [bacterium]|nr:hypothetical protein [bacterium]
MPNARCKICASPHRAAIDAMLDDGAKQAKVLAWAKEHAPELALNASNVSHHSRFHRMGSFEGMLDLADERLKHIRDYYGGNIQLMHKMLSITVLDGITQILSGERAVEPEVAMRAIRELRELTKLELEAFPETSLEKLGLFLYFLLQDAPELQEKILEKARASNIEGAQAFVEAFTSAEGAEGRALLAWRDGGPDEA